MKRISYLFISIFISIAFCSCVNGGLISLKDCPHEDSNIDTQNLKGNGEVYIVDVNFDGYKDIIKGNEKNNTLYLWNENENKFDSRGSFYSYPVFSPSEKSFYYLSIKDGYGWYHKYRWNNETEKDDDGDMFEVYTEDFDYSSDEMIKARYTLAKYSNEAHRNVVEVSCNEISGIPDEWQEVVSKIKTDYLIDDLYAKMESEKIRKKQVEDSIKASWNEAEAAKAYPQVCDEVWVDMGIESDDGQSLYWATSDLILRHDNTFGIHNYGEFGSEFGWADATGMAKSDKELDEYGGSNPPRSIVGNPEYDIVSAHLNSPARLPSKDEWVRLLENCERTFTTIKRSEVFAGTDGLPAWAQGQWMTEARIPKVTGDALVSLSVKIDGNICSVIATQGGQVTPIYEGVYDYHSNGELIMGGLTILVNEYEQQMITESGHKLKKVNNDTDSSKIYGLMLTSNINGNKLFFPIPSPNVAVKSGKTAIEFQSAQENEYWSGTLSEDNKASAYMFYIKGSNPTNVAIGYDDRFIKKSIRPVSTKPITVSIGAKKNTEQ